MRSFRVLGLFCVVALVLTLAGCNGGAIPGSFTLAVSPASVSVQAGSTVQFSVSAAATGNFNSTVTVGIAGLPTGVTASPATLMLTPGTPQTVTLTAASTAAAGNSTVTLTGTGSSHSQTATVALTVTPQPTFTLAITPAALAVKAGASGQFSVTASPSNGFTAPVTVAVTGLPAGVTASPASLTLTPGTPATVSLAATATAAAGATTVTLTGTSGSLTQTATLALTVSASPTYTVNLTEPSTTLTAGGAGLPVTFQVVPSGGFSGTVAVTLSGLPAGVTAAPGTTFNISPGTNATVTLTAAATATPGAISIQVAWATTANVTPTASSTVLKLTIAPPTGADVTTYHYDNTRQGWNSKEVLLTTANVNSTTFGLLGNYPVDGKVDAQPLYLGGLTFGTGTAAHTDNVVFVATENDSVYALNAATGAQEWKTSVLGSGETPSDSRNCGQIVPQIGITSTPVIDRSYGTNGAIFVIGMSKDATGAYHQRLHALDLLSGAELPNSPTEITASFPGTGDATANGVVPFSPGQYVARAGLLLINSTVYVGWSSHCDIRPYTGWVMGYSESTLKQSSVINLTPNGSDGSVWMSGYGLAADTSSNIFFADANGTLDAGFNGNGFPSQGDFGNAIVKLSTSGNSLAVADFWEPYNTVAESDADVDLGSGGAMLLPDLTDSKGAVRHLVVAAGKDTNIYVADRDNMGKFSAAGSNTTLYQELPGALPQGAWAGPAYFNNTVFYGGVNDNLRAFSITNALLSNAPTSVSSATFGYPGATPSVSSNGSGNGIVWALESTENAPAVLHAYDASNLQHELYNSKQAANSRDAFGNGNKFLTPVVSNGMVFVGTPSGVAVFGLLH